MKPQIVSTARRVLVLVNPRAGRPASGELPAALVERLASRGFAAEIVTDLARACDEADRLHDAGDLRAIVAAGGDGTIAEIVNRTEPGVPITTLPLGTENLLARYFHIPRDADVVAELIERGRTAKLDVGSAKTDSGERLFLLMASAGLDAEIVRRLHSARRGNISHGSYIWPILAAAATYRYPTVRVATLDSPERADIAAAATTADAHDQVGHERFARWVVAFNLPCYAGMLRFLSDGADGESPPGYDGQLDICRFDGGGFWHTLYYYVSLLAGRAERIGTRHVERLCRFRLEAVDAAEPIPLQIDGDAAGYLPVEMDVRQGRLTLIVPAGVGSSEFSGVE